VRGDSWTSWRPRRLLASTLSPSDRWINKPDTPARFPNDKDALKEKDQQIKYKAGCAETAKRVEKKKTVSPRRTVLCRDFHGFWRCKHWGRTGASAQRAPSSCSPREDNLQAATACRRSSPMLKAWRRLCNSASAWAVSENSMRGHEANGRQRVGTSTPTPPTPAAAVKAPAHDLGPAPYAREDHTSSIAVTRLYDPFAGLNLRFTSATRASTRPPSSTPLRHLAD